MTRTRLLGGILALAVLALPSAPANGFRVSGSGGAANAPHLWSVNGAGNHRFSHWDLRELPNCVAPWSRGAGTADIAGAGEWAPVTAAFATWNAVDCSLISWTEVAAPGGAMGAGVLDGNNIVDWGGGLGAGTLALTTSWFFLASGQMVETDLRFNDPNYNWTIVAHAANMNGNPDIQTVGTHEVGHMHGLDHANAAGNANPPGPIMNPSLFLNDDVVVAGGNVCGAVVGANVNIIGPGANGLFESTLNNCPGGGDDAIAAGFIHSGPDGNVDTQKNPDPANHLLSPDDRDGVNFLYCMDLGDAPDPWGGVIGFYPTLVHNPGAGRTLNGIVLDARRAGAEHIFGIRPRQPARNYTYEWLGRPSGTDNVDSECEANVVDLDPFDDGVTFVPNPPIWGRPALAFGWLRYANDAAANGHAYAGAGGRSLYFNLWIDLNQNCIWQEGLEHPIDLAAGPANPVGANATGTVIVGGLLPLPPVLPIPWSPVWVRARLDWGEDAGAVANVDGTLVLPAGAAQFGEVEDYPLWCISKYKQLWLENVTPNPKRGVEMVFVGDCAPPQHFWADVDQNDCVLTVFPPSSIQTSYNGVSDETTVDFLEPGGGFVLPGRRRHSGRCQPPECSPLTDVRAQWIPVGSPSVEDLIPTTNCMICFGDVGLQVIVGAVDDQTGGILGGRDPDGNWPDVIHSTVSYRVSPVLVPLQNLSPCDPMVAGLPSVPMGTAPINPEIPFTFQVPYSQFDPTQEFLILETSNTWSINGNTSHEILVFENPLIALVDAPEIAEGTGADVRLESRPNPSTGATVLLYRLPEATRVSLRIYDVRGALVRTVERDVPRAAGEHRVTWDARDDSGQRVPAGIYFYQLDAGKETTTKKLLLLR
jgi:hypothetical protein